MPASSATTIEAFTAQPGFIRRFCSCGVNNRCSCGLPLPATGWTVAGLTEVRQAMKEHLSLSAVVEITGRSRHDCNVALFALMGRTPAHALAALEAKAARART